MFVFWVFSERNSTPVTRTKAHKQQNKQSKQTQRRAPCIGGYFSEAKSAPSVPVKLEVKPEDTNERQPGPPSNRLQAIKQSIEARRLAELARVQRISDNLIGRTTTKQRRELNKTMQTTTMKVKHEYNKETNAYELNRTYHER